MDQDEAGRLWDALVSHGNDRPSLQATHVAYYFGALLIAGAMGWFVTQAFDRFSGLTLSAIACAYAFLASCAATYFWRRPDLRILGGICATIAVCMAPLAIFGIEKALHLWPSGMQGSYSEFHPYVRASWIYMELGTVAAGLVTLRFFAFPFITAPIAYALWYLSMDSAALFLHKERSFHGRCYFSIGFGVVILLIAFFMDHVTREDYSFWGYLFGMLALWGGLSLLNSGNEPARFLYCCLNVGFVILSLLLGRRVFLVFGALGIFGYLASLAHMLFKDSILFPFAISILGIAVIALGVFWQKNIRDIERFVVEHVPIGLSQLLPSRRT